MDARTPSPRLEPYERVNHGQALSCGPPLTAGESLVSREVSPRRSPRPITGGRPTKASSSLKDPSPRGGSLPTELGRWALDRRSKAVIVSRLGGFATVDVILIEGASAITARQRGVRDRVSQKEHPLKGGPSREIEPISPVARRAIVVGVSAGQVISV